MEQSIVKDSKSRKGGTIGISRQESATLKWYLTVHIRSATLRNFKQFCDLNDIEEPIHRTLNKPSIVKDEQDIQSIASVIIDRFGNLFSISVDREECERPDPLINMAIAIVASEEVTKDLLTSKEIGRKALEDYTKIRIQNQSVSVTKPIKRLNLKTFATMASSNARVKKHANNRIEEDRDLFGRLLVISKDRSVDLEQLFTYELSSIPQAIANNDGSLTKTNKAQTLHDLEANVQPLDHDKLVQVIRKSSTAVFVDHMACAKINIKSRYKYFWRPLQ